MLVVKQRDWMLLRYMQMDLTLLSFGINVFEFEFCLSVCLSVSASVYL